MAVHNTFEQDQAEVFARNPDLKALYEKQFGDDLSGIKVFIEGNGIYGGVLNIGKEKIYGIGDNQKRLLKSIRKGLLLSKNKHMT